MDPSSKLALLHNSSPLELKEHSSGKAIAELKKELSKLNEAHSEKIHSLEGKVKKVDDRCSAKEKKRGAQEKSSKIRSSS